MKKIAVARVVRISILVDLVPRFEGTQVSEDSSAFKFRVGVYTLDPNMKEAAGYSEI
jgi:hypothetical protein